MVKRPVAVLIDNPNAGRLSDEQRRAVLDAVADRFEIDALSTTARTTGITMAREVIHAGEELVIAFGGDGHVNEVANGIAGTEAAMGIIPGGTMTVFARAVGIPTDPFEAIDRLADAVHEPPRKVTLGRMDDRYFAFSAGCGFDAEAAERVELDVLAKRRFGELFFYWSAFRVLSTTYRHRKPALRLKTDRVDMPVAMAIASNTGPYAYLRGRPIRIAPNVELDAGIDVFAMRTMKLRLLPLYTWRCVASGDLVDHPDAFYQSDLSSFEVTGEAPFKRHVDGEPLEPATSSRFEVVPDVLKVYA